MVRGRVLSLFIGGMNLRGIMQGMVVSGAHLFVACQATCLVTSSSMQNARVYNPLDEAGRKNKHQTNFSEADGNSEYAWTCDMLTGTIWMVSE